MIIMNKEVFKTNISLFSFNFTIIFDTIVIGDFSMVPKLNKIVPFGNSYLELEYVNGEKKVYCSDLTNPNSKSFSFFTNTVFPNFKIEECYITWKSGYKISKKELYENSLLFSMKNINSKIKQYNLKILTAKLFENLFLEVLFENGECRLTDLTKISNTDLTDFQNFEININYIVLSNGLMISSDYIINNSFCVYHENNPLHPLIKIGYWLDDITCVIKFENGEIKLFNPTKWIRGLKNFNYLLDDINKIHNLIICKDGIYFEDIIIVGYEDIYKYGLSFKN